MQTQDSSLAEADKEYCNPTYGNVIKIPGPARLPRALRLHFNRNYEKGILHTLLEFREVWKQLKLSTLGLCSLQPLILLC